MHSALVFLVYFPFQPSSFAGFHLRLSSIGFNVLNQIYEISNESAMKVWLKSEGIIWQRFA